MEKIVIYQILQVQIIGVREDTQGVTVDSYYTLAEGYYVFEVGKVVRRRIEIRTGED